MYQELRESVVTDMPHGLPGMFSLPVLFMDSEAQISQCLSGLCCCMSIAPARQASVVNFVVSVLQEESAKLLLKWGADARVLDNDNMNAMELAKEHPNMLAIIQSYQVSAAGAISFALSGFSDVTEKSHTHVSQVIADSQLLNSPWHIMPPMNSVTC